MHGAFWPFCGCAATGRTPRRQDYKPTVIRFSTRTLVFTNSKVYRLPAKKVLFFGTAKKYQDKKTSKKRTKKVVQFPHRRSIAFWPCFWAGVDYYRDPVFISFLFWPFCLRGVSRTPIGGMRSRETAKRHDCEPIFLAHPILKKVWPSGKLPQRACTPTNALAPQQKRDFDKKKPTIRKNMGC